MKITRVLDLAHDKEMLNTVRLSAQAFKKHIDKDTAESIIKLLNSADIADRNRGFRQLLDAVAGITGELSDRQYREIFSDIVEAVGTDGIRALFPQFHGSYMMHLKALGDAAEGRSFFEFLLLTKNPNIRMAMKLVFDSRIYLKFFSNIVVHPYQLAMRISREQAETLRKSMRDIADQVSAEVAADMLFKKLGKVLIDDGTSTLQKFLYGPAMRKLRESDRLFSFSRGLRTLLQGNLGEYLSMPFKLRRLAKHADELGEDQVYLMRDIRISGERAVPVDADLARRVDKDAPELIPEGADIDEFLLSNMDGNNYEALMAGVEHTGKKVGSVEFSDDVIATVPKPGQVEFRDYFEIKTGEHAFEEGRKSIPENIEKIAAADEISVGAIGKMVDGKYVEMPIKPKLAEELGAELSEDGTRLVFREAAHPDGVDAYEAVARKIGELRAEYPDTPIFNKNPPYEWIGSKPNPDAAFRDSEIEALMKSVDLPERKLKGIAASKKFLLGPDDKVSGFEIFDDFQAEKLGVTYDMLRGMTNRLLLALGLRPLSEGL